MFAIVFCAGCTMILSPSRVTMSSVFGGKATIADKRTACEFPARNCLVLKDLAILVSLDEACNSTVLQSAAVCKPTSHHVDNLTKPFSVQQCGASYKAPDQNWAERTKKKRLYSTAMP
jgi:hypothetical protein